MENLRFLLLRIKVIKDTLTLMQQEKDEFIEKLGSKKAFQQRIDELLDELIAINKILNDE